MAVTKEQIFSAADELAASGQRPTLEAIRKITGGSYTASRHGSGESVRLLRTYPELKLV